MRFHLYLAHAVTSFSFLFLTTAYGQTPTILLPKHHLDPAELAVIINDADPLSVQIGNYYQERRGIPSENIIHVKFSSRDATLSVDDFVSIKQLVDRQTPANVQAYALAWTNPVRVGCMSITTAFADRYDPAYCAQSRCGRTKTSSYFDTDSSAPYTEHGLRPAVMLASRTFQAAKDLIDRGIRSDRTHPSGAAYLLDTNDHKRNLRATKYPFIEARLGSWLSVHIEHADFLADRDDVLFYFTGQKRVKNLDTLGFVAGAIADHLTSFGGELLSSSQMSSLRWLEAGATGSYGTVIEPCAISYKFPDPEIVMRHYLQGETLLEAYWKSVAWPGQGIFIGEPLAAPFAGYHVSAQANGFQLLTRALKPGNYRIYTALSPVGPYHDANYSLSAGFGDTSFQLPPLSEPIIRIVAQDGKLHRQWSLIP